MESVFLPVLLKNSRNFFCKKNRETLSAACQIAIEAEIANVQMYDDFLNFVQEKDLSDVFTQLHQVSATKHELVFERSLNSKSIKS